MDDRLLSSVRDGAIDLRELLASVRKLAADPEGREALYDGARERMLAHLLADCRSAEVTLELKDAFQRISSYAKGVSPVEDIDPAHLLAVRLEVLAHAVADYGAFSEAYDVDTLREQPHVQAALAHLYHASGRLPRSTMVSRLGLKQANGTRLLKLLEKARLVSRLKSGQKITVELTPLGRKKAMAWLSPVPQEPSPSSAVISLREGRVRGMHNDQWSIAAPRLAASGR